jgi:hypothetical protein
MDFENAAFYKAAYPVVTWWGVGAAIGPLGAIAPIAWALRRWSKSSELWKVEEEANLAVEYLLAPKPGSLRVWNGNPYAWLA